MGRKKRKLKYPKPRIEEGVYTYAVLSNLDKIAKALTEVGVAAFGARAFYQASEGRLETVPGGIVTGLLGLRLAETAGVVSQAAGIGILGSIGLVNAGIIEALPLSQEELMENLMKNLKLPYFPLQKGLGMP